MKRRTIIECAAVIILLALAFGAGWIARGQHDWDLYTAEQVTEIVRQGWTVEEE